MKKKEIEQLKNMAKAELESKVKESRTRLATLISDKDAGKLKNAHAVTMLRKDIARMLTFMNQNGQ